MLLSAEVGEAKRRGVGPDLELSEITPGLRRRDRVL